MVCSAVIGRNNKQAVRMMLEADPSLLALPNDEQYDEHAFTPIFAAVLGQHVDIIREMVARDPYVLLQRSQTGITPRAIVEGQSLEKVLPFFVNIEEEDHLEIIKQALTAIEKKDLGKFTELLDKYPYLLKLRLPPANSSLALKAAMEGATEILTACLLFLCAASNKGVRPPRLLVTRKDDKSVLITISNI